MGVCDAIIQYRDISEDAGIMVIGGAFTQLFPGQYALFSKVLHLADDLEFQDGQMCGGREMMSLLTKQQSVILGLATYLRKAKRV